MTVRVSQLEKGSKYQFVAMVPPNVKPRIFIAVYLGDEGKDLLLSFRPLAGTSSVAKKDVMFVERVIDNTPVKLPRIWRGHAAQ